MLATLRAFDLRVRDLHDSAAWQDVDGRMPAPLRQKSTGPTGATFMAELALDPDAVRRQRAESDIVVGEISRKPITLEAALRAHSADEISGTISVAIEADAAGQVRRRTKVTRQKIKDSSGRVETQTVTEILERRAARPDSLGV